MASHELFINEIFHSLQGESTLAGVPFAFVRLTGCNLRCTYCDSTYAFHDGKRMTIDEVCAAVAPFSTRHVLLTGGEPLMQKNTPALAQVLVDKGYDVSVETHGELPIGPVVQNTRVIMDIKTPSSGMQRGGYRTNLPLLKETDEVKFVIASESDYAWARDLVRSETIPVKEILFSPVGPSGGAPGSYPGISAQVLAERILADRLRVRMQIQLHKIIWGADARGV